MDKNAIKKYAVWARNELIERVSQKADQYEISADADPNADSAHGVLLTADEKKQRAALIKQVKEKGQDQVMEEVAYTWFNRFSALRFMEVNNYLPSRIRVFTDENGKFKPEILAEAIHLDLDGLDMEKVYALKDANDDDALFKYFIITQCNALSGVLPRMFQKIADYTELLFPDNLLREGSVVEQMVAQIPEEDWKDQVQIIGWLYQYYNLDIFNDIYDGDNSVRKIEKNNVPAATQLFTPDWVVRYMVENSLGRIWIEGHPNDELKSNWKYYLEEAKQEPGVQKQLDAIKKEYARFTPDQIRAVDPCMGSGHIICYMFDVLMQIYEVYGYTTREAVVSIVRNNLYGLDIDERASQLAYFAVMMKACQYDSRFLSRNIEPNIFCIRESNGIAKDYIDFFAGTNKELKKNLEILIDKMHDASELGSIIKIENVDFSSIYQRIQVLSETPNMYQYYTEESFLPFVKAAEILSSKFDIAVTNPPYLSRSRFDNVLSKYVNKHYPDERADLATVMVSRVLFGFLKKNSISGMITTVSWMFIHSFQSFREKIVESTDFVNLVDFGTELFDGKIGHLPIASWVNRKSNIHQQAIAIRLVEYCYSRREEKKPEFFNKDNWHIINYENIDAIPGKPIAYWISDALARDFKKGIPFEQLGHPRVGMQTSNNDKYLRFWHEINYNEMCDGSLKWIKYIKGGPYRKWYGNLDYVVWYNGTPVFILKQKNARVLPESELTTLKCTWSDVASTKFACRTAPVDSFHDIAGHCFYPNKSDYYFLLGYVNSCVFQEIINLLNSSIHYQTGDVARVPVLVDNIDRVSEFASRNEELSKKDWDSFENSWDFERHPLIQNAHTIKESFSQWQAECEARFNQLKANEEELNRIFIDIYDLQDELTPEEEDKDVTVRKADLGRDIRSFVSYAVGCMMGRYSLDVDGLAYAGGEWDSSKYKTFIPDKDAIIPITDDEYFTDDIVGRFVEFVRTVYVTDTLEENLQFIADALDEKGSTSREKIRNYFLNDFYKDHLKTYQKRPIYWLFDSGKKNGFKCLVYMHRYQPDTIARIRTDYVHEQQARYRTAISGLERQINGASTSERVRLNKQLTKLRDQAEETRLYEEKIHHLADQMISIDLDDGVKHNYAISQDVLAKIK